MALVILIYIIIFYEIVTTYKCIWSTKTLSNGRKIPLKLKIILTILATVQIGFLIWIVVK